MHGLETLQTQSKEPESSKPPSIASSTNIIAPPTLSYADLNKKCCYLCTRQFKTEAEVNKHERLSKLHQDNLQNEELKAKALVKLGKPAAATEAETSEYRDRAKERRVAFNQPKQPKKISTEIREAKAKTATPPAEEDAPKPVQSKGASLLGKMGWTAGAGLGAQGTGSVAPIATELYAQGVGLGAEGGKIGDAADEASRNTKGGYAEFLERTKDKAKARFESLS